MAVYIIIPARYGSTRLKGKPLAMIAGVPMVERVWRLARAANAQARVIVATDDERIRHAVHGFGGEAMLTPTACRNGTERCYALMQQLGTVQPEDIIVNLQGDAPLTPPWVIAAMIDALAQQPMLDIATPAVQLDIDNYKALLMAKRTTPASGTFVTFDVQHRALYFSKNPIPFLRDVPMEGTLPVYRHIGLYAYRARGLAKIMNDAPTPTPLEQAEQLEQLRWLEHGWSVLVVPVDYRGRTHGSVDAPEDIARVEAIIQAEGELVP